MTKAYETTLQCTQPLTFDSLGVVVYMNHAGPRLAAAAESS